jgi:hypothetical protein
MSCIWYCLLCSCRKKDKSSIYKKVSENDHRLFHLYPSCLDHFSVSTNGTDNDNLKADSSDACDGYMVDLADFSGILQDVCSL